MKKLYLDACIYYNLWKNEIIKKVIPAGLYAELLFERIKNEDFVLVVSDFLRNEITFNGSSYPEMFRRLVEQLDKLGKIVYFTVTPEITREAEELVSRHKEAFNAEWEDMIHLLIAKHNNAYFVTRDEELFAIATQENIETFYPEEVPRS